MKQVPWFERKFDFSSEQNTFPAIMERLRGTPIRIEALCKNLNEPQLIQSVNGSWSIKQNIGHLTDLEPIWQGRMQDILDGKKWLREADLSNSLTHESPHNKKKISKLLLDFEKTRQNLIEILSRISEEDVFRAALHPRLRQPLRTIDLFTFVADHDDHHLARMRELSTILPQ